MGSEFLAPRYFSGFIRRAMEALRGCFGADEGDRTLDLKLGKLALYQLSYVRSSSRHRELSPSD